MKLFDKKALLIVALMTWCGFNNWANATVTLDVEEHIKVTAIDGQAINKSLFKNAQRQFVLQAGNHVITAKYDRLYNLRKDEHDYLRSGNITVTAQLDDDQTYRLVMPNQPETYRDAKKFAKNPTLALMQGSQVVATESVQNGNKSASFSGLGNAVSGLFGGGNNSVVNQKLPAIEAVRGNAQPAPVANTGSTLDQFMQIWLQATPTERERIRGWVSNQ